MTLIIADDHTLFRDTLVTYLKVTKPSLPIICCGDFDELLEILKTKSDVIELMLVDFQMPSMSGRDGFQALVKNFPHIPFAMMSGVADDQDISCIMSLGARGYIPKTMSGQNFVKAIDIILAGEIFKLGINSHTLFPQRVQFERDTDYNLKINSPLSPREYDVLKLLEIGLSNREIAKVLHLKPVTVKLHVSGILRKLNLDNRTQAALQARSVREASYE